MAKTVKKSRRQRRSRHRMRKNKTMRGGMFGAMLSAAAQHAAQQAVQQAAARGPAAAARGPAAAAAAAPNQLAFLSQLPRGVITPQGASILQSVAANNPQALASVGAGVQQLASCVGQVANMLGPTGKQIISTAIQQAPLPAPQKMLLTAGLNVGSKVLPGAASFAYNQAVKNPQQALQLLGKGAAMIGNSGNFKF